MCMSSKKIISIYIYTTYVIIGSKLLVVKLFLEIKNNKHYYRINIIEKSKNNFSKVPTRLNLILENG